MTSLPSTHGFTYGPSGRVNLHDGAIAESLFKLLKREQTKRMKLEQQAESSGL